MCKPSSYPSQLPNAPVGGKLVCVSTRIEIPENPPRVPPVIYSSTVPLGAGILRATLKDTHVQ